MRAARAAARTLGSVVGDYRLVVTHGNGPQVGLLALINDASAEVVDPYPADVHDAESAGQIGYVIEWALGIDGIRVIPTGGDSLGTAREQWDDGIKVLTVHKDRRPNTPSG